MATEPCPAPPTFRPPTSDEPRSQTMRSTSLWAASLAFAVSPLVGVLTFVGALCEIGFDPCTSALVLSGALLLSPFAYAAGLLIGIPAFVLMRRCGLTRAWLVVPAGGVVASAGAVVAVPHWFAAAMVFAPGCVAGLAFWLIAVRRGERG